MAQEACLRSQSKLAAALTQEPRGTRSDSRESDRPIRENQTQQPIPENRLTSSSCKQSEARCPRSHSKLAAESPTKRTICLRSQSKLAAAILSSTLRCVSNDHEVDTRRITWSESSATFNVQLDFLTCLRLDTGRSKHVPRNHGATGPNPEKQTVRFGRIRQTTDSRESADELQQTDSRESVRSPARSQSKLAADNPAQWGKRLRSQLKLAAAINEPRANLGLLSLRSQSKLAADTGNRTLACGRNRNWPQQQTTTQLILVVSGSLIVCYVLRPARLYGSSA